LHWESFKPIPCAEECSPELRCLFAPGRSAALSPAPTSRSLHEGWPCYLHLGELCRVAHLQHHTKRLQYSQERKLDWELSKSNTNLIPSPCLAFLTDRNSKAYLPINSYRRVNMEKKNE